MSTQVNTELYERAAEMIDYFQDKLPAQLIEKALKNNDLDALRLHVAQAEAEVSRQEFYEQDCN